MREGHTFPPKKNQKKKPSKVSFFQTKFVSFQILIIYVIYVNFHFIFLKCLFCSEQLVCISELEYIRLNILLFQLAFTILSIEQ